MTTILSFQNDNSSIHDYNILGTMSKQVANHDYLGVTMPCELKWLNHVTKVSNKASRTLGLLKTGGSQNVKYIAYKMLVLPKLEYASEVWNPHTIKCIKN